MSDCVLVFSGGMDSTVLLVDLLEQGKTVQALSFDYGSKHNRRELSMAAAFCREKGVEHRIVKLPFVNELFSSSLLQSGEDVPDGTYKESNMKSTVVPFRNGIMLSIAAGFAESVGARQVSLASHSGDHFIYPDCRPEFNNAFSEAVFLGSDKQVCLLFPYSSMDKREIGDLGRRLGVDFSKTWTCYRGGEHHCGTCGACDERKYALRQDEGLDPTIYLTPVIRKRPV